MWYLKDLYMYVHIYDNSRPAFLSIEVNKREWVT